MALDARDFLSHHLLENFARPEKIIAVSAGDTVLEAMKTMADADILCAPVLAENPASDNFSDRYIGIVNIAKLALSMIDHLGDKGGKQSSGLQHLMALKHIQDAKLGDLAGSSGFENAFEALPADTTLLEACKHLGTMNVHRIPVLKDGKLCNFITQSAVIKALVENIDALPETSKKTLTALHLAQPSDLVVAKRSMTALEAFHLLKDKDIGAMPIVESNGSIIGNISVRDLRGVITRPKLFEALHKSITEFVAANVPDKEREEMYPSITCKASSTLAEVLTRLASSRIHRIYVVDANNKPIRALTLSDVLAAMVVPNAD